MSSIVKYWNDWSPSIVSSPVQQIKDIAHVKLKLRAINSSDLERHDTEREKENANEDIIIVSKNAL